jgi:hypothetical protein
MTSTVRAAASAPSSLLRSSPESLTGTGPSPSPPQETHRTASGPHLSHPTEPELPLHPAGVGIESPSWSEVHPALIDQLVSLEAHISSSPVVGGYIYGQSTSSHMPHTPFPFPMSARPASPSRFSHLPQVPAHAHPHLRDPQYTEGSSPSPTSTISDASTVDARWVTVHGDMHPQYTRPRTPSHVHDRVLRQSSCLSLTEAWSQIMAQMDIQPVVPQRL